MIWLGIVCISFISSCFQKLEKSAGLISFLGLGYLAGTPNMLYDPDAFVYLQNYNSGTDYFETGYNWVTKLFEPSVDYQTFRLYSSLFIFFLMFLAVLLMTKHVSSIALVYAIAMFPVDKAQTRNVMAAVFVLFGAVVLLKLGKRGILPSLLVIFIGSFFHSLALYFLLLPLLWLFKGFIEKHFSAITTCLIVVAFIFEILGSTSIAPLLVQLLGKFANRANVAENVSTLYAGGQPFSQWFVSFAVTMMIILTVQFLRRQYPNNMRSYYQMILCSSILWSAALILMTLSIDYIRILRIVTYFYFIYIVNVTSNQKSTDRLIGVTISIGSAVVLMFVGLWVYGFSGDQIRAIFGFI
ncbi:EpsG family protein [Lacticaseibacillus paracasei]|uniref:EpsG family protein n=1 Tax=Lacticaseibacillus paracasei TaxID=1597 RepID=UPI000EB40EE9|nr:hypothetical protein D9C00_01925 [Lacticaseibacillus paracasei]